jgi:hypothetical protein
VIIMGMITFQRMRANEAQDEQAIDLNEMTVKELREYAEINGIDLGNAKKKAEILTAINEAQDEQG